MFLGKLIIPFSYFREGSDTLNYIYVEDILACVYSAALTGVMVTIASMIIDNLTPRILYMPNTSITGDILV